MKNRIHGLIRKGWILVFSILLLPMFVSADTLSVDSKQVTSLKDLNAQILHCLRTQEFPK